MYTYLGTLGIARTPTGYDKFKAEQGKTYTIYFNKPEIAKIDYLLGIVYNGKTVLDNYKEYWNGAYAGRFELTSKPVVVGDKIRVTGKGTSSGETFGKLGLDRYWATGRVLWDKTGFLNAWERRGIENMVYVQIVGPDGRDLIAAAAENAIKQEAEIQKEVDRITGGSSSGGNTSGNTSSTGKFPTVPVVVGGVVVIGLVGLAIALKRKKKVA
jgi:hypothetical protein